MYKVYNTGQVRSARRFTQLLIFGLCTQMVYPSLGTTALPMDLGQNNNGRSTFQLKDRTLDILNSKRGVIAYTSKLETSRQVKFISKFIDFSSIGMAMQMLRGRLIYSLANIKLQIITNLFCKTISNIMCLT